MVKEIYDYLRCHAFYILCLILIIISFGVDAQETELPFYAKGTYIRGIPTPDEVIGYKLGTRPTKYEEVVRYLKILDEKSERVRLIKSGESHEKRNLYYLIVSSEENMAKLDDIQNSISKLADPRKITSESEAQKIIKKTPAIAWMMYTIHGNELSGTESSLQLAYQLAAGTDSITEKIRREVVVCIDPMENPDGRERYLAQMQQWAGNVSNTDAQGMKHKGVWPYGRTNHYLFDLNRDWFILAHPESHARVKALLTWKPQVVVDAHEMWYSDTYLFNPPREPFNPNLDNTIKKWWKVFAADQAKAFDQYGWSYYTREWLEEWYPGYGSAWPLYLGAISILYEQANTSGSPVKQPDGYTLTFRESIHHQFISSMANLITTAENRSKLLQDYYKMRKAAITPKNKSTIQAFYIDPTKNPSRAQFLIQKLLMMGIEVEIAEHDFKLNNLKSYWDQKPTSGSLPKGTFIIPLSQPLSPLINAIMEFDPRMTTSFLKSERDHLEKKKGTRMYEVSAWSMPIAYDVEAYISTEKPVIKTSKVDKVQELKGEIINSQPTYGFIIDYKDDKAVDALVKLFESGYKIHIAKKPFQIEGRTFSRGSILLRLHANPSTIVKEIKKISESTGTKIYGVNSALSQKGPDLGGREFQLLVAPKIALLTGPGLSMNNFGAIWYLLDYELKFRHTILNYNNFSGSDLRKYNVLIIPSTWRDSEVYKKMFNKKDLKKLKSWVSNGGTLIGIGNSAAFLADSSTKFSKVKLRRQALKELSLYNTAVKLELDAGQTKIDSITFWEGKTIIKEEKAEAKLSKIDLKALSEKDKQQRLFMPRGAILRVDLDQEHWLNFGVGDRVPAIVYTSNAFLSKDPVQTPARFSEASKLRLSGLLWPEARTRWERSAYVTREAYGNGQIILFAGEPNFRSYFYGTARILINSMIFGPGFGTKMVEDW